MAKKIFVVVGTVLFWIVVVACLFAVVITVMSKKDKDGTATVFGYQLRFVQSSSMEKSEQTDVSGFKIKEIRLKSCVFVKVAPSDDEQKAEWYKTLQVGDVITFKYVYTRQETITHRIVRITPKPTGGEIITLEGDNRSADSETLSQQIDTSLTESPNYIIGKVTGQSYILGLIVYALKNPIGIVCIIIVPCTILIVLQILRIKDIYKKSRKDKPIAEPISVNLKAEIKELKQKVIELRKAQLLKQTQQQNTQAQAPKQTQNLQKNGQKDRNNGETGK